MIGSRMVLMGTVSGYRLENQAHCYGPAGTLLPRAPDVRSMSWSWHCESLHVSYEQHGPVLASCCLVSSPPPGPSRGRI